MNISNIFIGNTSRNIRHTNGFLQVTNRYEINLFILTEHQNTDALQWCSKSTLEQMVAVLQTTPDIRMLKFGTDTRIKPMGI
jgi:hypothetical protein